MPKRRVRRTPEFRAQMVEGVHARRTSEELAREFVPAAEPVGTWVCQPPPSSHRGCLIGGLDFEGRRIALRRAMRGP
jgi:hypothetical protein